MATDRLDTLKALVEQNPADSRTRYMLAMELARQGAPEAAVTEFAAIADADADYVAAYYHGGQALESLGRLDEARETYRRGIQACDRTGNQKTKSELQDVLDALGDA
ncbi:MAG: tetratricopeptide repeat protein [Bryobacteraceae bacterium]|nr:tetratricopeptide repeat protein [Bryobacteraceae bacterium]